MNSILDWLFRRIVHFFPHRLLFWGVMHSWALVIKNTDAVRHDHLNVNTVGQYLYPQP